MVRLEMSKKSSKTKKLKITVEDYIKSIKKADREIQLSNHAGWQRTNHVHKSKKVYSRKNNKNNYPEE